MMDDIETMAAQLKEFSREELDDLKQLAMDAYQVKKGRRDEMKKVLDTFSFFISKGILAKHWNISHDTPKYIGGSFENVLAKKDG